MLCRGKTPWAGLKHKIHGKFSAKLSTTRGWEGEDTDEGSRQQRRKQRRKGQKLNCTDQKRTQITNGINVKTVCIYYIHTILPLRVLKYWLASQAKLLSSSTSFFSTRCYFLDHFSLCPLYFFVQPINLCTVNLKWNMEILDWTFLWKTAKIKTKKLKMKNNLQIIKWPCYFYYFSLYFSTFSFYLQS